MFTGAERLVTKEEACRREGRGHRLPGHPGGGEERRPAEGDDRAAAAAGERALGADDTGRSGGGAKERGEGLQPMGFAVSTGTILYLLRY